MVTVFNHSNSDGRTFRYLPQAQADGSEGVRQLFDRAIAVLANSLPLCQRSPQQSLAGVAWRRPGPQLTSYLRHSSVRLDCGFSELQYNNSRECHCAAFLSQNAARMFISCAMIHFRLQPHVRLDECPHQD